MLESNYSIFVSANPARRARNLLRDAEIGGNAGEWKKLDWGSVNESNVLHSARDEVAENRSGPDSGIDFPIAGYVLALPMRGRRLGANTAFYRATVSRQSSPIRGRQWTCAPFSFKMKGCKMRSRRFR
jgi:hypothetical protein